MVLKSRARSGLKWTANALARALVFPAVCLAAFGRFHEGFIFGAQALALVPGIPGSYLRVAFYSLTLEECGKGNHIALGSYFSHSQAAMGHHVGIGPYCILRYVSVGDHTMIGPRVQILSGANQHVR